MNESAVRERRQYLWQVSPSQTRQEVGVLNKVGATCEAGAVRSRNPHVASFRSQTNIRMDD
jgi:hypothetical protein